MRNDMMDGDNAWLTVPHPLTVGLVPSSARRVGEAARYTEGHGQPSFCYYIWHWSHYPDGKTFSARA